jgi:hypothetical protein
MTVTTTSAPGAVQLSSRIDASTSPANASQIAGKGAEPDRVPAICKAQAGGHRVTRRSLMNMFVGTAAVAGAATIAGTEILSDPAAAAPLEASETSPELRDAIVNVREAQEALEAAKKRFQDDDKMAAAWREANPEPKGPKSRRAQKRWWRKFREMQDATETESWHAQLEAENKFREAQTALAKVRAKDMNELEIKAAAAYIYDAERMSSYGRLAIISYGVTLDLMRMKLAREDAAA